MSLNMNRDKRASAWELQDLDDLAGAEEGAYLEFKKPSEFVKDGRFLPDKLSKEIAETISAFLNSDGGVLLIGVQTDLDTRDKKVEFLRGLNAWVPKQTFEHFNVSLTASQVRDRIYGNILPRPFGVEVKALIVPVGNGNRASVFVVTVPKSNLGAHQSAETRLYYRRTADGDIPMFDYEIRDVNNRRAGPLLYLECAVLQDVHNGTIAQDQWKSSVVLPTEVHEQDADFGQLKVIFAASNIGRGTASVVRFDIGIPDPWHIHLYSPDGTNVGAHWEPCNALPYLVGDRVSVFWSETCREAPSVHRTKRVSEQMVKWHQVIYNGDTSPAHPIWPMVGRVVVGVLALRIPWTPAPNTCSWWLPWSIYAEGMPETRGATLLRMGSGWLQSQLVNYEMDDVSWCGAGEDDQRFNDLKRRFKVP